MWGQRGCRATGWQEAVLRVISHGAETPPPWPTASSEPARGLWATAAELGYQHQLPTWHFSMEVTVTKSNTQSPLPNHPTVPNLPAKWSLQIPSPSPRPRRPRPVPQGQTLGFSHLLTSQQVSNASHPNLAQRGPFPDPSSSRLQCRCSTRDLGAPDSLLMCSPLPVHC